MLTAAEIRRKYIEFFVERGHTHVASSPIVPPDDPTMLFTSAGMVQFKALYSGTVELPYTRSATVQKCLRAGGKGSDLENVGKTLRHHTFFEMLGNFSFGDYFKREAITWAWEFCTDPKWLNLPAERLWPTIFGVRNPDGTWKELDAEAEQIWLNETGAVNPIHPLNEKENFWGPAGETGACGPCSELLFFMGTDEELAQWQRMARSEDPADRAKVLDAILNEGDLFLEIWNLVFPQFDQQPDGSRPPLKNRGIDTGAGLERVTTVCQFQATGGMVRSPYETDLLRPVIEAVESATRLPYPVLAGDEKHEDYLREQGLEPADVRLAMNACADHVRALTFTLAEGIVPSNEGRGYVLRRILRRAARFGKKIGMTEPFLYQLVDPVVATMGELYPELKKFPEVIKKTIRTEEESFTRALTQGIDRLEGLLEGMKQGDTLSGEVAFDLYQTLGLPLDVTREVAEDFGIKVDDAGYQTAYKAFQAQSRKTWGGGMGKAFWQEMLAGLEDAKTVFIGYDRLGAEAKVLRVMRIDEITETKDGKTETRRAIAPAEQLRLGQQGVVVLGRTPFYAESGGQIGDRGSLNLEGAIAFNVTDTQKTEDGFYLHFGTAETELAPGAIVSAEVDPDFRREIRANHSSVHLMQAAMKKLVGEHVTQQGSWVGPEGMRFDFTNPEPVSSETLRAIEAEVNGFVRGSLPVVVQEMTLEEARATGAIAPFGEKYGARVRVVRMGGVGDWLSEDAVEPVFPVSVEFCGGTHVHNTGELGLFVITGESSVASGIRRIEGKAGRAAFEFIKAQRGIVDDLARKLSAKPEALAERLESMQEEIKTLRRQVEDARAEKARAQIAQAAGEAKEIKGVKLIAQQMPGAGANELAQAWDEIKNRSAAATVGVFLSVAEGKVNILVGCTDDIAPARVKAGDILKAIGEIVGGKGGGKPQLARGGGTEPGKVAEALDKVEGIVEGLLA